MCECRQYDTLIAGSTGHQTNVFAVISNSLFPEDGSRLFLHSVRNSLSHTRDSNVMTTEGMSIFT